MTTRNDKVICALVSAVVHLQEYIDTDEPLDLEAAKSALQSYSLQQWTRHNFAMIPVRRDGKGFYE